MTAGPATLRPMRWWDVEEVAQLELEVFPDDPWTAAAFWSELAGVPSTRYLVVAECGGRVVGYGGLMTAADLADSGSAARRLVDAGAVKIDGVAVPGRQYDLEGSELDGRVLAVGKRKVARVTNLKN